MVEQMAFQTVFQFLQTMGILVGVFYYVMTIRANQRNQQLQLETRQAQLFMQPYNRWSDPDFARYYGAARHLYTGDGIEIGRKSVDPHNQDLWLPFHS
jgi:hypothetical protein